MWRNIRAPIVSSLIPRRSPEPIEPERSPARWSPNRIRTDLSCPRTLVSDSCAMQLLSDEALPPGRLAQGECRRGRMVVIRITDVAQVPEFEHRRRPALC